MSEHDAPPIHPPGWSADLPAAHPATDLRYVRVEYADGPDRCTVQPRDPSPAERTTAWLTADRDAFVDLSSCQ